MKNFMLVLLFGSIFTYSELIAQTVVVTDVSGFNTGDPSAVLDIHSISKGLLIPRVTLTSNLSSPSPVTAPVADGLLVYNEVNTFQPIGFYYWNATGAIWTSLAGAGTVDGTETEILSTGTSIVVSGSGKGTAPSEPYVINFRTQSVTKTERDALSPSQWQIIWCSNCGTSGEFQMYNGTTWTNAVGGTRTLAVGESYGGGKVAYIFQSGDPGYVAGEVHGIIVSAGDVSTSAAWGCSSSLPGADGTILGTGNQNTTDIITGCGTSGIAARLCFDYSGSDGSKSWFLPSLDELTKIYQNKATIGTFLGTYYWSSSESTTNAYRVRFDTGASGAYLKSNTYYVRAIRYF